MLYKGKELKDLSKTPQSIVPPRDMLVWDEIQEMRGVLPEPPLVVKVLAIVDSKELNGQVIAENNSVFLRYGHCADIPVVYATFRQIARWLAEGKGEVTDCSNGNGAYAKSSLYYFSKYDGKSSEGSAIRVRKWDDTEWREPTLEYMGLEG